MKMGQDQDIKRYINTLLRRWWVVVTLSLVIGAATYFLTPDDGPRFTAFSSLLFEDPTQQPGYALPFASGPLSSTDLARQVQTIKSPVVLRAAASKVLEITGIPDAPPDSAELLSEIRALEKTITVRQNRNSNIVGINATAVTGTLAAARANAVADAFIEHSAAEQTEAITARLDSITRQIEGLRSASNNEASAVPPQGIADMEDQVAVVGEGISSLLAKLESIREAGSAGVLSVNVLSSMSATLDDVLADLSIVEANLVLLGDREMEISGTSAADKITSGLIASADLLDRGAAQLEAVGVDGAGGNQLESDQLNAEIQSSIRGISQSLAQAADNLGDIDEGALVSQGLLGQAKTSAEDATDAIRSSTNLVSDALVKPGPLVNESRLRAARDSLGSLDNDVVRLISRMRFLSEGESAVSQSEERQQIVNQFQAVQAEINVVIVDIRAIRGEETGSLNIGSLQTAEVQALVANNGIDAAVAALQSIGQANAVVSISEIESKLRRISNDVLGLPQRVAAMLSASDDDEQLSLELMATVTAMEASLDTAVSQIQARRLAEIDSDNFIPLFVAESRAIQGVAGLTTVKVAIDGLANPSGTSADLEALMNLGDEMALAAAELRLLDSQFGGSLDLGTISESQLSELSDRAGARSAALDLIIQSLLPLRLSITNVEMYGIVRNSESHTLDAQRELALVADQLRQLTGSAPAIIGVVRISDVRNRTVQISATVSSSKTALDELISAVQPTEPVPAIRLTPLGDRIVAAGEILLSLSQSMASIRAPESDVEARAKLISVEEQLQASSVSLVAISNGIDQLAGRPNALVEQAIGNASNEGRTAGETFNAAAQRLRLIRGDINAGEIIRPDRLIVLGDEFRSLEQIILLVSTYLERAEVSESLLDVQADLASIKVSSDDLGLIIGTAAGQFEALGQPSAAEATLYTQLLDSQRQLQLGRLLFDNPTVSVLETAIIARNTGTDDTLTKAIVGLAAGFMLGTIIVLMLEYMDKRLRGQEDIKRQLGLAPLGVIPIAPGTWNPHPQIKVDTPPSSFSESLRMVRTAVDLGRDEDSAQVLLVTSPREGDGKTTIALNLARSMAMENKKVLLVDGNLHTPEVAIAFQIEDQRGLSDALKADSAPADYVVEADGVHILPGGGPVDNPADLLATPTFKQFLLDAKKDYDIVIMDSPPAIDYADTVILAKNADGVIFTYRARHTTAADAEAANEVMNSVGTPTVGVVLNMADERDSGVVYPKVRRTAPHPPPSPKWRLPWFRHKLRDDKGQ